MHSQPLCPSSISPAPPPLPSRPHALPALCMHMRQNVQVFLYIILSPRVKLSFFVYSAVAGEAGEREGAREGSGGGGESWELNSGQTQRAEERPRLAAETALLVLLDRRRHRGRHDSTHAYRQHARCPPSCHHLCPRLWCCDTIGTSSSVRESQPLTPTTLSVPVCVSANRPLHGMLARCKPSPEVRLIQGPLTKTVELRPGMCMYDSRHADSSTHMLQELHRFFIKA